MDFILDSMAQLTAATNRLAESHVRDRARIAHLEDSFVAVTGLLCRHEERHDLAHYRMIDIETAVMGQQELIRKFLLPKGRAGAEGGGE